MHKLHVLCGVEWGSGVGRPSLLASLKPLLVVLIPEIPLREMAWLPTYTLPAWVDTFLTDAGWLGHHNGPCSTGQRINVMIMPAATLSVPITFWGWKKITTGCVQGPAAPSESVLN